MEALTLTAKQNTTQICQVYNACTMIFYSSLRTCSSAGAVNLTTVIADNHICYSILGYLLAYRSGQLGLCSSFQPYIRSFCLNLYISKFLFS